MTTRYRHRRTSDAAVAFPSPIEPGEIAANTANRQLAIGDAAAGSPGVSLPLIAVRYFDQRGLYGVGDYAVNTGQLYRCKVAHGPAVFNGANFEAVQGIDYLTGLLAAGYLPLSGGALSGQLSVVLLPTANAHATSKKYVDDQIAANVAGGVNAAGVSFLPTGNISSSNVQAALAEVDNEKAPANSPTFTGTPASVTPAANDNSTKIATTAFYAGQAGSSLPGANGVAFAGASLLFSRVDHTHPSDTTRAPLDSAPLTGAPTAPTPIAGDNTTRIATTAFVMAAVISNIADGIVTFAKMAATAIATTAQFWSNTAQKILTSDQVWAAAVPQTLTDGATVTPDLGAGIDFIWTIAGAGRTLFNPTNIKVGQKGMIYIVQDGTGGRTITTWGSYYKFSGGTKPTLSTGINAIDCVGYSVKSATEIECFFAAGMA